MLPALPAAVRAGDTLAQLDTLPEYPAPTWVLTYTLVNAAGKQTLTATASGQNHQINATAATTAGWAPGAYTWVAAVASGATRTTLNTGAIQVLPDLAAATTYDTRSPAKKALEAIEAALATYGAKAHLQAIRIGERQQTFHSPSEFMALRARLQSEVKAEENALRIQQGLGSRNRLLVRFTGR